MSDAPPPTGPAGPPPGAGPAARAYGDGDATFQALGGEPGIARLVDAFYARMEADPDCAPMLAWHRDDPATRRARLATFLGGWTGGPRRYAALFGPINIPQVHRHLAVGARERDLWLRCMAHALTVTGTADDLARHLLRELAVPAERIRQVAAAARPA